MNVKMKKLSTLIIAIITAFIFVALISCTTSAYAVTNENLKIEYDGDTKIISNIQFYLTTENISRSVLSQTSKINRIMDELSIPTKLRNEEFVQDIKNSEIVYSTRSVTPDYEANYNDDYIDFALVVLDQGEFLNNKPLYTCYAIGTWHEGWPSVRKEDAIYIAYAGGNSLGAGNNYSDYGLSFSHSDFNGVVTDSIPRSDIKPTSGAAHWGASYPLPAAVSFIPMFVTKDISLFGKYAVTATDDFIVAATYAHQTRSAKLTPSINLGVDEHGNLKPGASIDFSFENGIESYNTGHIRVFVNR